MSEKINEIRLAHKVGGTYCKDDIDFMWAEIDRLNAIVTKGDEIVYCKDCVYYNTDGFTEGYGCCEERDTQRIENITGDYYCGRAIRDIMRMKSERKERMVKNDM